ncbi:21812_t:CDS:2 [Gigaspora rosea]|nr:21812_t:CDS:2 [Gigaspora rosea]
MDETPVWFDMAGGLTMNPKGAKTVHIRTTGNDKNRFTVVLTCLANGKKLPPVIIFKGKVWPANTPQLLAGVVDGKWRQWFTKKGNLKRAGLNTVCCWVLDAWNEISKDIIIRAFKKCGISNCLSRSEDHFIYDNESDESEIEDFDNEKSDEDNEDEEFDEVDKVEESDKNE